MFKPTHFRFQNSIQWPGAGPTTEIAADNIQKVDTESDHFAFVHASGHAVKVPKGEVTAYGVYDADDVPNLPTEEAYKDDVSKLGDNQSDDTGNDTGDNFGDHSGDQSAQEGEGDKESATASDAQSTDKPSNDALLGADSDNGPTGLGESDADDGPFGDTFGGVDTEEAEGDDDVKGKKKKIKKNKKDK